MRLGKLTLCSFAAVLTLHCLAAGQNPSASTLKVYSRETIVDVTVTDSKGKLVRDLKQSDFTLLEDNHPMQLRCI